ncbi:MAG: alpha/beta hydrolase [Planctomycetota bacterium]
MTAIEPLTFPAPALLPALLAALFLAPAAAQGGDEEDLPPAQDLRAGDDEHMRYFLIGPKDPEQEAPKDGYKLLLVLPGGDGGADFQTFVRRIAANACGDDWVVAQLVAPMWSEKQAETLVWPTRENEAKGMKFATEDFVAAVVRDVEGRVAIDPEHVFTLSWSSGGPAAYAASLDPTIGITGSFVAMSVFKPDQLPSLKKAKGHAYFLLHSPQDFIPIAMAQEAVKQLGKAGAEVELLEYEGGHGWRGNVYGTMRQGLEWLQQHHAKPDKKRLAERKKAEKARAKEGARDGAAKGRR